MIHADDARLHQAFDRLEQARKRSAARRDDTPVETVQALAAGTYIGSDKEALLDRVLSDPHTADEFRFFMDLERSRPVQHARQPFRWSRVLLAATTLGAVALGTVLVRSGGEEPLRGGDSGEGVSAHVPVAAAPGAEVSLAWRPVDGATGYDVEVFSVGGLSIAAGRAADTVFTVRLPAEVSTDLQWRVSARLPDGTVRRSATQPLPVTRRP